MALLPARERLTRITTLGLPIMGGMLSQSLLNLIDAAMVGSLGSEALAGVGLGSYANFMAVALVMGLGAGVQAMVARRKGAGATGEIAGPLNEGLLIALLLAGGRLLSGGGGAETEGQQDHQAHIQALLGLVQVHIFGQIQHYQLRHHQVIIIYLVLTMYYLLSNRE